MAIRTRVNSNLIDLTFQGKPVKKVITGEEVIINHPAIPDSIDTNAMRNDTIFYSMSDGGNYNNGYGGAMSVGVSYSTVSINTTNKSAIFNISITIMGALSQGLPQNGQVMLEVLTSFVEINGALNMIESQGAWEISGSASNRTISFAPNAWNLIYQEGSPAWDETVVEARVVYEEPDTYKWAEVAEMPTVDYALDGGTEATLNDLYPPTKTFLNKTAYTSAVVSAGNSYHTIVSYFDGESYGLMNHYWAETTDTNYTVSVSSGEFPPSSSFLPTSSTQKFNTIGRVISDTLQVRYYKISIQSVTYVYIATYSWQDPIDFLGSANDQPIGTTVAVMYFDTALEVWQGKLYEVVHGTYTEYYFWKCVKK